MNDEDLTLLLNRIASQLGYLCEVVNNLRETMNGSGSKHSEQEPSEAGFDASQMAPSVDARNRGGGQSHPKGTTHPLAATLATTQKTLAASRARVREAVRRNRRRVRR